MIGSSYRTRSFRGVGAEAGSLPFREEGEGKTGPISFDGPAFEGEGESGPSSDSSWWCPFAFPFACFGVCPLTIGKDAWPLA